MHLVTSLQVSLWIFLACADLDHTGHAYSVVEKQNGSEDSWFGYLLVSSGCYFLRPLCDGSVHFDAYI